MFLTADYVWWILGGCIAIPILALVIVATVIAIVKRAKLATKYPSKKVNFENNNINLEYIEAFGNNNIKDVSMEMSRITVTVKDVDIVNAQKLKELGASGVLLVGDQIKCSFKENVENIYNTLKGSIENE